MGDTKRAGLEALEEPDFTEMELRGAGGEGLGMYITLAGPEHEARRAHRYNVQREMRRKLSKLKNPTLGRVLAGGDPEDEETQIIDYLVACTLGWRHINVGGTDIVYSKDAARRLYEEWPKVRRQVRAFLDDEENFWASSPTR